MGKNARLANIYIKIYNKKPLMMEDLIFLSKYDPECFEKTCKNLVYKVPEAKKLMEEEITDLPAVVTPQETTVSTDVEVIEQVEVVDTAKELQRSKEIENLLENLKKMEWDEPVIQEISADKVKNLLGLLYMEKLFPHNDKTQSLSLDPTAESSFFNKKV